MARVRELDHGASTSSSKVEWYSINSPYHVTYGPFAFDYRTKFEKIVDQPGKLWIKYSDGRRAFVFKPVKHVVWSFAPNLAAEYAVINGTSWSYSNLYTQLKGWGLINPGVEVSSMIYDRLRTLIPHATSGHYERWLRTKPSVVSRSNMTVFLIELRDIKRMFDLIPNKHFKFGNWRDVLKYANGQHLNWNFGWKPFLSDLKKVARALRNYDERLLKFMKNAGVALKSHAVDRSEVNTVIQFIALPDNWKADLIVTGTKTLFSTFDYSYTVPQYEDPELFVRSFLDTVGLNLTAANVWRVLPFSFVVDWFVDLGSFLDQYSTDWLQPWINFNQACTSARTELRAWVRRTSPAGSPTVTPFGEFNLRVYDRCPGIPQFSLDSGSLTADKIRLLASLGFSFLL